jgi:hypothetical protein
MDERISLQKGQPVIQRARDHTRQFKLLLAITVTMGSICHAAAQQAQQFECGFVYEKMKDGKSGAASCSYSAEKVFSFAGATPFPSKEHCRTEDNGRYEDLVNFRVDLATNKVAWDEQSGLSPFYVPRMIEFYMREEKLSKEAATEMVARSQGSTTHHDFDILHTDKIFDITYVDEITKKSLSVPEHTLAYLVTFRDDTNNYSLYISGKRGNAILSEYVGGLEGDASWVNLRFGKCRKLTATPQ